MMKDGSSKATAQVEKLYRCQEMRPWFWERFSVRLFSQMAREKVIRRGAKAKFAVTGAGWPTRYGTSDDEGRGKWITTRIRSQASNLTQSTVRSRALTQYSLTAASSSSTTTREGVCQGVKGVRCRRTCLIKSAAGPSSNWRAGARALDGDFSRSHRCGRRRCCFCAADESTLRQPSAQ